MTEKKPSLSGEAGRIFYEGIGLVLSRWSALQLAIDNEWGGRDSRRKASQIHADTFNWFTRSTEPLCTDDLIDKLDEGLDSLNTMTADGSVEEVAAKLMIIHEECLVGNFKSIDSLRETMHRRIPVCNVRQANDDDDDDDDDDDEDVHGNEVNMAEDRSSGMSNSSVRATSGSSVAPPDPSSDNMQVDEPTPQPSAEEQDGWEVVKSKRRGKKKN